VQRFVACGCYPLYWSSSLANVASQLLIPPPGCTHWARFQPPDSFHTSVARSHRCSSPQRLYRSFFLEFVYVFQHLSAGYAHIFDVKQL